MSAQRQEAISIRGYDEYRCTQNELCFRHKELSRVLKPGPREISANKYVSRDRRMIYSDALCNLK